MKPKKCFKHDACIYSGQVGCLRDKTRIKPRINFRSLLQYIMKVVKPKKGKGSYKRTKKVNLDE
jgi:hypothetical protein